MRREKSKWEGKKKTAGGRRGSARGRGESWGAGERGGLAAAPPLGPQTGARPVGSSATHMV